MQAGRYLYWRQLRDMKGSAVIEAMTPFALAFYARQCGWTLARAHARSGDPVAIAAYLGKSDKFDQAIVDFSERYADQNERDYKAFAEAVKSGRLAAWKASERPAGNRSRLGESTRPSVGEEVARSPGAERV